MTSVTGTPRLALGQGTLAQLKAVLERDCPEQAPALLREIGFGAGEGAYDRFVERVADRYGVETPQSLDTRYLSDALGGFLREEGWGSVTVATVAPGVVALDSSDWTEATAKGAAAPSCHFSAGFLSDFLTRLAGYPAAVMEVECRCQGGARCRFLVGSADLLTWLYEGLLAGTSHDALLEALRSA